MTAIVSKKKADGDLNDAVTVSFLDFGGQEVFYPMHSFLITPKGFYLILFNMESLLPTALPEEKARELDYLRRWINAIVVGANVRLSFDYP